MSQRPTQDLCAVNSCRLKSSPQKSQLRTFSATRVLTLKAPAGEHLLDPMHAGLVTEFPKGPHRAGSFSGEVMGESPPAEIASRHGAHPPRRERVPSPGKDASRRFCTLRTAPPLGSARSGSVLLSLQMRKERLMEKGALSGPRAEPHHCAQEPPGTWGRGARATGRQQGLSWAPGFPSSFRCPFPRDSSQWCLSRVAGAVIFLQSAPAIKAGRTGL